MINYRMSILTNGKHTIAKLQHMMNILVNISSRLPLTVMIYLVIYGCLTEWL